MEDQDLNAREEDEFDHDEEDDDDSIPLADDDASATDSHAGGANEDYKSLDSLPSGFSDYMTSQLRLEPDYSPDEAEEKARLISQVLELQNTLDDLTSRVDAIREENFRLRAENSVLSVYIENLMNASNVFAATSASAPSTSTASSSSKATLPQQLGTAIRCTARALGAAHRAEKQDCTK